MVFLLLLEKRDQEIARNAATSVDFLPKAWETKNSTLKIKVFQKKTPLKTTKILE